MAPERGFTLMLAALIASIVLALGTSIYDIAQKEITLSSMGRDSQFAFYAADTAAECALYWDFRCNYFATSSSQVITTGSCSNALTPGPTCDGQSLFGQNASPWPNSSNYPYTMTSQEVNVFSDTGSPDCVQISVTKCQGTFDSTDTCQADPNASIHTLVLADGYNVPCSQIDTSTQSLQRTAEWRY